MKLEENFEFSLLEMLSVIAHCGYLSDLRSLQGWERAQLARRVEKIPYEAAPLSEWNAALRYLSEEAPQPTAKAAREHLLLCLACGEKNGGQPRGGAADSGATL